MLLYGPPGTGKTSLAQLCIHDAGVNLFSVNGAEIVSHTMETVSKHYMEFFIQLVKLHLWWLDFFKPRSPSDTFFIFCFLLLVMQLSLSLSLFPYLYFQ